MTKQIELKDIKFPKSWDVEVDGSNVSATKKVAGKPHTIKFETYDNPVTAGQAKDIISDLKSAFKRAKARAEASK